jgi:antitoxin VapB
VLGRGGSSGIENDYDEEAEGRVARKYSHSAEANVTCKRIYVGVYISGRRIVAIARVFKSGNSQAVRLPKKFRVKSSEVEIFRRGDEIVLREKAGGMIRVLDLLAALPADMFPKKRKDPQPQRRRGL